MHQMQNSRIFVAGHKGMVGSALIRQLENKDNELITRERKELDLLNQQDVIKFFRNQKIDQVYLSAAKVGGINANNVNNVNLYITSFDGNSANNGNDIYVWNSANVTVQSTCPPGWFGEPVAGSMLDTSTTGGGTISGNLTSFDDG